MKQVIVAQFGGVEQLQLVEVPTPTAGPGQVLVKLTSVGMNHADLMARRGEYKLASGDPPFVPGIEGGGVIEAVGQGVTQRTLGQRVILGVDAPRLAAATTPGAFSGGTYRTHYLCQWDQAIPAPPELPDEQLGAVWLPYLTAWGCLIWKQNLQPGQFVALPAASSSVALAAAQIARQHGAITIGLTTSVNKVDAIRKLPTCAFDHLVVTRTAEGKDAPWHKELRSITSDHGVDVFFDPVAAGAYLSNEIRCLAQHGTVWVYGLLGKADVVDVTPLIRKWASVRGWALSQLALAGPSAFTAGYQHILEGFAKGVYRQHVARVFALEEVRQAHEVMEQGKHIGKMVIKP